MGGGERYRLDIRGDSDNVYDPEVSPFFAVGSTSGGDGGDSDGGVVRMGRQNQLDF